MSNKKHKSASRKPAASKKPAGKPARSSGSEQALRRTVERLSAPPKTTAARAPAPSKAAPKPAPAPRPTAPAKKPAARSLAELALPPSFPVLACDDPLVGQSVVMRECFTPPGRDKPVCGPREMVAVGCATPPAGHHRQRQLWVEPRDQRYVVSEAEVRHELRAGERLATHFAREGSYEPPEPRVRRPAAPDPWDVPTHENPYHRSDEPFPPERYAEPVEGKDYHWQLPPGVYPSEHADTWVVGWGSSGVDDRRPLYQEFLARNGYPQTRLGRHDWSFYLIGRTDGSIRRAVMQVDVTGAEPDFETQHEDFMVVSPRVLPWWSPRGISGHVPTGTEGAALMLRAGLTEEQLRELDYAGSRHDPYSAFRWGLGTPTRWNLPVRPNDIAEASRDPLLSAMDRAAREHGVPTMDNRSAHAHAPPGHPFPGPSPFIGRKVYGEDFAGEVIARAEPCDGHGRAFFVGGHAVPRSRFAAAVRRQEQPAVGPARVVGTRPLRPTQQPGAAPASAPIAGLLPAPGETYTASVPPAPAPEVTAEDIARLRELASRLAEDTEIEFPSDVDEWGEQEARPRAAALLADLPTLEEIEAVRSREELAAVDERLRAVAWRVEEARAGQAFGGMGETAAMAPAGSFGGFVEAPPEPRPDLSEWRPALEPARRPDLSRWVPVAEPPREVPNPFAMVRMYGARNRPPGYATAPPGFELVERSTPQFHYGVIRYPRALTVKEMYSYELTPFYDSAETAFASFLRAYKVADPRNDVGDLLHRYARVDHSPTEQRARLVEAIGNLADTVRDRMRIWPLGQYRPLDLLPFAMSHFGIELAEPGYFDDVNTWATLNEGDEVPGGKKYTPWTKTLPARIADKAIIVHGRHVSDAEARERGLTPIWNSVGQPIEAIERMNPGWLKNLASKWSAWANMPTEQGWEELYAWSRAFVRAFYERTRLPILGQYTATQFAEGLRDSMNVLGGGYLSYPDRRDLSGWVPGVEAGRPNEYPFGRMQPGDEDWRYFGSVVDVAPGRRYGEVGWRGRVVNVRPPGNLIEITVPSWDGERLDNTTPTFRIPGARVKVVELFDQTGKRGSAFDPASLVAHRAPTAADRDELIRAWGIAFKRFDRTGSPDAERAMTAAWEDMTARERESAQRRMRAGEFSMEVQDEGPAPDDDERMFRMWLTTTADSPEALRANPHDILRILGSDSAAAGAGKREAFRAWLLGQSLSPEARFMVERIDPALSDDAWLDLVNNPAARAASRQREAQRRSAPTDNLGQSSADSIVLADRARGDRPTRVEIEFKHFGTAVWYASAARLSDYRGYGYMGHSAPKREKTGLIHIFDDEYIDLPDARVTAITEGRAPLYLFDPALGPAAMMETVESAFAQTNLSSYTVMLKYVVEMLGKGKAPHVLGHDLERNERGSLRFRLSPGVDAFLVVFSDADEVLGKDGKPRRVMLTQEANNYGPWQMVDRALYLSRPAVHPTFNQRMQWQMSLAEVQKDSGYKHPAKLREVAEVHFSRVANALRCRAPVTREAIESYPDLVTLYGAGLSEGAQAEDVDNPADPDLIVAHSAEIGTTIRTARDNDRHWNRAIHDLRNGFKWLSEHNRYYRTNSRGLQEATIPLSDIANRLRGAGAKVKVEFTATGAEEAHRIRMEHKAENAERSAERAKVYAEKAEKLRAEALSAGERSWGANTARRREMAKGKAERLLREAHRSAARADALARRSVNTARAVVRGQSADIAPMLNLSEFRAERAAVLERADAVRATRDVTAGGEEYRAAMDAGKKELAFFATPPAVAERMAELAGIVEGDMVLEPSAGMGALVDVALAHGAKVMAVEFSLDRCKYLQQRYGANPGVAVICDNFLDIGGALKPEFDAILTNPPFSGQGSRSLYAAHIELAMGYLAPGGTIVAIVPSSFSYSNDRAVVDLRRLLESWGAHVEELPEDTFKSSGTSVRALLVVATEPTAAEERPDLSGWVPSPEPIHPHNLARWVPGAEEGRPRQSPPPAFVPAASHPEGAKFKVGQTVWWFEDGTIHQVTAVSHLAPFVYTLSGVAGIVPEEDLRFHEESAFSYTVHGATKKERSEAYQKLGVDHGSRVVIALKNEHAGASPVDRVGKGTLYSSDMVNGRHGVIEKVVEINNIPRYFDVKLDSGSVLHVDAYDVAPETSPENVQYPPDPELETGTRLPPDALLVTAAHEWDNYLDERARIARLTREGKRVTNADAPEQHLRRFKMLRDAWANWSIRTPAFARSVSPPAEFVVGQGVRIHPDSTAVPRSFRGANARIVERVLGDGLPATRSTVRYVVQIKGKKDSDVLTEGHLVADSVRQTESESPPPPSAGSATVHHNARLRGIEIAFGGWLTTEQMEALKSAGFRRAQAGHWYAPDKSPRALAFAQKIDPKFSL